MKERDTKRSERNSFMKRKRVRETYREGIKGQKDTNRERQKEVEKDTNIQREKNQRGGQNGKSRDR